MRLTSSFAIQSWTENAYDETSGQPKLTRASVTQSYTGDIEGQGAVEYLMAYGADGSANYVSLERVTGRIGERIGSFVLRGTGAFEAGVAKADFFIVPGSGTAGLGGIRGQGSFIAKQGEAASQQIALDVDFD